MEQENRLNTLKKQTISKEHLNDYQKYMYNKEKDSMHKYTDKVNSRANVSLIMGSEERLKQMQENFEKLNSKVDENMNNYVRYNQNVLPYAQYQQLNNEDSYKNTNNYLENNNDANFNIEEYNNYNVKSSLANNLNNNSNNINSLFQEQNIQNSNNIVNNFGNENNGNKSNANVNQAYDNFVENPNKHMNRDFLDKIYDIDKGSYKQVIR